MDSIQRNKAVVLLIAVSLFFSSATGCGEDKSTNSKTNHTEKKAVLSFWSWADTTDYIRTAYEKAISNFNANNPFGVIIRSSYIPGEQYKTKMQTEMAANSAPDILNMWAAGKMKPYVEAGRLYPIGNDLLEDSEWKSRYHSEVFKDTTFEDTIYGIPQIRVASVIYYNKELFSKYGMDIPQTWFQLLQTVRTFRDNGIYAFALDGKDPWIGAMYGEYIAERLDPEAYERVLQDGNWMVPAYIETGRKLQELAMLKAFPENAINLDYIGARKLFDEEKAAMYLQGNWDVGYLASESPIRDKVGAMKFPLIEGGQGDDDSWLAGIEAVIAVSSKCKNPKAAAAFLKYLSEDEIAKDLIVEKGGYISSVKVRANPQKQTQLYKEVNNLLQTGSDNFGFYDVSLGPVVGEEFNKAIHSIIAGTSPEEAFGKLTEITREEMARGKK